MDRRAFISTGLKATAAATLFGKTFWRTAFAGHRTYTPGLTPYGPLGDPDLNGFRLPEGFSSRVIGATGSPVEGTSYVWHVFPDGGATYATPDGGWIYVSNSETPGTGGAGAVRFGPDGEIADAYRILAGTSMNCAGGPTPWGTWLSCEEHDGGLVWECDPTGETIAVPRPAMGVFRHEAAVVDGKGRLYLTEDHGSGRFYRFLPDRPGDLSSGLLQAAAVATLDQTVTWVDVPNPLLAANQRPPGTTFFNGGEGAWYDATADAVYFTTKGDDRVWICDLSVEPNRIEVLFDGRRTPGSVLNGVDNLTMSRAGEIVVCEDNSSPVKDLYFLFPDGSAGSVAQLTGQSGSEFAGAAFDPSGRRLYVSSQRGGFRGLGITYEISGPFLGAIS